MMRWIALPFLCLSSLVAEEPPSPPAAVFSVSATLVQIDCVVTDSAGHQVVNLTKEGFEILVDGKPQPITNFSYVRLDSPPPPTTGALKPEDIRRSMVLVVDDLSLSFSSMYYVRRTLRKFIDEQMQPGDLVALWETGRNNSVFQQFTSDKRVLAAAVENLQWNPRGLGLVDPFAPMLSGHLDNVSFGKPQVPRMEPRTEKADELAYVRLNATMGTLDTLAQLMDELRPVSGRKAVVLFSDGIYLPGQDLPGQHTNTIGVEELQRRFRRLIDKANRSGAVVYGVDARGLLSLPPEKPESLWLSQEGLVRLSEDTGGFAAVNTNGYSEAVQRVEEEQKGYYLIGFKAPENIGTGSATDKVDFHSIHVRVNGRGLHAHSRSGFFGETDEASRPKYGTPQARMVAAVQSLFNKSDLHVRMTALYRRTVDGQTYVHNLLYIDPRDITFRTDLFGTRYAALDLFIMASGYGVDPLASMSRHIAIDADEDRLKKLLADGVLLTLDVPVKHAGPYQVRACVLDSISHAAGSAGQYIDIPDLKKQHIALTTPLVDDTSAPAETRFNDVPSALREFHAGSRLAFAFRIEGERGGKFDARVQLYHDKTPVLNDPVSVPALPGKDGRDVRGELRLSSTLAPGQYYLEAMATDSGGKTPHSASSWIEFQVVQ